MMGMGSTPDELEKWIRQALLRIQLLAANNDSEYPEQSVRYVLFRVLEVLAGRRINAELKEYAVNEIFRVLALNEKINRNKRLRTILLARHHRIPKPAENTAEINEIINTLGLPTIPENHDLSAFIGEVYKFCEKTGYLTNGDTPSLS